MKILVTGGSGFLGGAIVRLLESEYVDSVNDELTVFDTVQPEYETKAKVVIGDIRYTNKIMSPKYDIIFHCAGLLGTETLFDRQVDAVEVNIIGTINTLGLCKKDGFIIQPNMVNNWANPYMITKRTAERFGLMYRQWHGTKYVSVRFTDLYGERQSSKQKKANVSFIQNALDNQPISVYSDGHYKMNLLYIEDAAKLLIEIAYRNMFDKSILSLGSVLLTNTISTVNYAKLIIDLCGSTSEIKYLPSRLGQPDEVKKAPIDLAEVKQLMDKLSFTETSLRTGLAKTINYYKG